MYTTEFTHQIRPSYINVTKIYEHLEKYFCRGLLGFHALTVCNFNPAFFKKIVLYNIDGKWISVSLYEIRRSKIEREMKTHNKIFSTKYKKLPAMFIMFLAYSTLMLPSVSCFWIITPYLILTKNSKQKIWCEHFACKTELFQQFHRANYIASISNIANIKPPTIFTIENKGWTFKVNE